MPKTLFIPMILLLAGCNTAPPAFMGVPAQRIDVAQSTFDVRIKGDRINAVRLSRERAFSLSDIAPRAIVAMEKVSGCDVVAHSLVGDAIVITADLDC